MPDETDTDRRAFLTLLFLLLFAATLPTSAKARTRRLAPPEDEEKVRHADASWVWQGDGYLPWVNCAGTEHRFTFTPGAWIDILGCHCHQWWTCQIESMVPTGSYPSWSSGCIQRWKVGFRIHHIDEYELDYPGDREETEWELAHKAKVGDLEYGEVRLADDKAEANRLRAAAGRSGRGDGSRGPKYEVPMPVLDCNLMG